jgi:hypothetical protein
MNITQQNQRLAVIRDKLKLNVEPWLQLPNDLLLMAFRPASVNLPSDIEKELRDKYDMTNLEDLEF